MGDEIKTEAVAEAKVEKVEKVVEKVAASNSKDMDIGKKLSMIAGAVKFVASRLPGCEEDLKSVYPDL
jgi:hypothetical protein